MTPELLTDVLLFLALVNPVSKVFMIHVLSEDLKGKEIKKLVIKSTFFALIILVLFSFAGSFILKSIFHIEVHALQVAGGIVLAMIGFKALRKGVFFEVDKSEKVSEMAMVPMASPIIAGPATITAAIVQSTTKGSLYISFIVLIALFINFVFMHFSPVLSKVLNRFNLGGALIRITGLFVASIGIDMALTGIGSFYAIL